MEPEVLVYVNNHPLDALLDLGCNVSFIDQEMPWWVGCQVSSLLIVQFHNVLTWEYPLAQGS